MFVLIETVRFVLVDSVLEVIYFPIWYYTTGSLKLVRRMKKNIHGLARALNLKILWRFLLQPMYGQHDFWGRLISVVMRCVQFAGLLVVTLFYSIFYLIILIAWLALPLVIVWNILYHFQLGLGESFQNFIADRL